MIQPPAAAIAAKYLIKTHYIVRVLEFHPETQTVDVCQDVMEFSYSPAGKRMVTNEFGVNVAVTVCLPSVIEGIPVKQFRFGQFEIQACPAPGDTGYIEVFTNDIRDWIENGGLSVPWSDDHFLKQSCVFVPFVPNKKNCVDDYPANEDGSADLNKFVIKSKNTSIVINDVLSENEQVDTTITLSTPLNSITMQAKDEEGLISIKGDTELEGNLTVTGDVSIDGELSVTGNISTESDVTVEGTIEAKGDIKSTNGDVLAGSISLKNHTHSFQYVGAGQGATPQQGTTVAPK